MVSLFVVIHVSQSAFHPHLLVAAAPVDGNAQQPQQNPAVIAESILLVQQQLMQLASVVQAFARPTLPQQPPHVDVQQAPDISHSGSLC